MMKLSYLKTHWTPEEAHTIISFLDDVRDILSRTYCDLPSSDRTIRPFSTQLSSHSDAYL